MSVVNVGDVIHINSFRSMKARLGVVVMVYKGGDGIRAVPKSSPWYERVMAALLTNNVDSLKPHNAEIVKASVQLWRSEWGALPDGGEVEVPS